MPFRNITLIYNPRAGSFRKGINTVRRLVAELEARGLVIKEHRIRPTTYGGEATVFARQAVNEQMDLVIVCGGDGTINEVAQGLVGSNTTMAILPSGTANVLAKELKLPDSPKNVAALIAAGSTLPISVGIASTPDNKWQRYFLLMAGIGLDASIIETVTPDAKRKLGIGSYVIAGLKTLVEWPLESFKVRFNQHHCNATFVVIANAANYAAWFKLAPDARMISESLEVCVFTTYSRLIYLSYAFLSLLGVRSPGAIYQTATEIFADSSTDTPVQLDGELIGHLPMRFGCIPRALHIVA